MTAMNPDRLAAELDRQLDGPHADEHTAAAAHLASECVRFLNYATGSHSPDGLVFPATIYTLAAELSSSAHRMTQLFGQLADWLAAQDAAGMLGTDDGSPVTDVVAVARLDLYEAADAANSLSARLANLQNGISGLNGRGPNRPAPGPQ